jgi:hypothetical protein
VEAALELVAADAATKDLELLCIIEPGTPTRWSATPRGSGRCC